MLTPEDAWKILETHLGPLPAAQVARAAATGRVLARPVVATVDMPPADVSAMDGYALAGAAPLGEPLPVVAVAAAGAPLDRPVGMAEAAKIMTGAVVPPGADRVVPVELSDGGAERVTFERMTDAGAHIRRRGEVTRRGEALLPAGTILTPGAISLLASHGIEPVAIHRPPTVAVLTTGDEIVPPDEEPGPGQLRDSNSAFLGAAGHTVGLAFHRLGIAPDTLDGLRLQVRAGLEHDVLLLCGGVSMGDYDFVADVLEELGLEILFHRVAIQPGKPLVAARHRTTGRWVLGLPGNPASVMVTFWLFVRPLLRRLMGLPDGYWHGALDAELAAPLPGAKGRDRFLSAAVTFEEGRLRVTPAPPKGSHDVVSYSVGDVLVRIPAHAEPRQAGEPCQVLPLVSWVGSR